MKKINYIAFVLVSALLLPACQDQLDLQPISQTVVGGSGTGTAGSAIKDASSAEAALAGSYSIFKNGSAEYYVMDRFILGDGQSDNAYAGADNAAWFEVDEFRILSTNAVAARDWQYLYNHVASANSIIANVPKVTDASLSASRKEQIVGEAKFIRARAYFDLVRIYGDIPLVVDELPTITSSNVEEIYGQLYPARSTAEEVYAQIIKDLDEAGPVVPKTGPNKMTVTPGAVYTLLTKVYATRKEWDKVITNADKVIALGYTLLPNFDDLWNGKVENSAESIFELNFEDWATGGNWGSSMFYGTDWKKFNTPSNDLIKAYDDEKDGMRKAATIFTANVTGKWSDKYWALTKFPFAYKMRNTDASQNIIMYRLADVLLLKAEALNETGNLAGARTLVNQIRTRVKLPATPAADQSAMRLAIEKERRLELAFEANRWFDLKRTDRVIPVLQAVKDGSGNSLKYNPTENRLLWPIPQGEIDKNANLKQNEGY
jgi:hypothetical protein